MATDTCTELPQDVIDDFARDGVVVLRGVFADWVERLQRGVDLSLIHI